jgi:hypothetical protein
MSNLMQASRRGIRSELHHSSLANRDLTTACHARPTIDILLCDNRAINGLAKDIKGIQWRTRKSIGKILHADQCIERQCSENPWLRGPAHVRAETTSF